MIDKNFNIGVVFRGRGEAQIASFLQKLSFCIILNVVGVELLTLSLSHLPLFSRVFFLFSGSCHDGRRSEKLQDEHGIQNDNTKRGFHGIV